MRVAFIGLGNMGIGMAQRLLGHDLRVHNPPNPRRPHSRTPEHACARLPARPAPAPTLSSR
jgi:3-hydroxyisobutyrate dehydrogenase-like beta-hydroxyacid dehydrogenase